MSTNAEIGSSPPPPKIMTPRTKRRIKRNRHQLKAIDVRATTSLYCVKQLEDSLDKYKEIFIDFFKHTQIDKEFIVKKMEAALRTKNANECGEMVIKNLEEIYEANEKVLYSMWHNYGNVHKALRNLEISRQNMAVQAASVNKFRRKIRMYSSECQEAKYLIGAYVYFQHKVPYLKHQIRRLLRKLEDAIHFVQYIVRVHAITDTNRELINNVRQAIQDYTANI